MVELLQAVNPTKSGISKIIVWGGRTTLSQLESRPWLVRSEQKLLNRGLPYRIFWQRFCLSDLAIQAECDVLFVPGGAYAGDFHPVVVMSQNLLPFEWCELRRFGWSWMTLKLLMLRFIQSRTFCRAEGVILLTRYARDVVMREVKRDIGNNMIVPHGVGARFFVPPREQLPVTKYSVDRPFRFLYVSIVDAYKHQWQVVRAVQDLRKKGLPVELVLVGPSTSPALKCLKQTMEEVDPTGEFVFYKGAIDPNKLHAVYRDADAFVFASSCENLPIILLEAMASGLPIAASNYGPMPEILGEHGIYFDPENEGSIADSLERLIKSASLRGQMAQGAFLRANEFSWRRCADDTFSFIAEVAKTKRTER